MRPVLHLKSLRRGGEQPIHVVVPGLRHLLPLESLHCSLQHHLLLLMLLLLMLLLLMLLLLLHHLLLHHVLLHHLLLLLVELLRDHFEVLLVLLLVLLELLEQGLLVVDGLRHGHHGVYHWRAQA